MKPKVTREQIELQIQELLKLELSEANLSSLLFSREGLFNDLALALGDRDAVMRLPLYRQAKDRLNQLSRRESTGLREEVARMQAALRQRMPAERNGASPHAPGSSPPAESNAPAAT